MMIPIMLSDLSEEIQIQIITKLATGNPTYLEILEAGDDAVAFIDLDEISTRNNFVYHMIEMNETEEEEKERPGFVISRTNYVMENYNCPDFCICLDIGEDRIRTIFDYLMTQVINKKPLKDFYEFCSSSNNYREKIKLIDSEDGELIYVVVADSQGFFPEHRKCDSKFARQHEYIEYVNSYYQEEYYGNIDT